MGCEAASMEGIRIATGVFWLTKGVQGKATTDYPLELARARDGLAAEPELKRSS